MNGNPVSSTLGTDQTAVSNDPSFHIQDRATSAGRRRRIDTDGRAGLRGRQEQVRCRCIRAWESLAGPHHAVGRGVRRDATPRQVRVWSAEERTREGGRACRSPAEPVRGRLAWGTGSIVVGDQTFEGWHRYKGSRTIMDTARTIKSFKIDLDRAGGTGSSAGQDDQPPLRCHRPVEEPQTLAYELYRTAAVPASRTTLAEVRLTVPGKYDRNCSASTRSSRSGQAVLEGPLRDDKGLLMKPEACATSPTRATTGHVTSSPTHPSATPRATRRSE